MGCNISDMEAEQMNIAAVRDRVAEAHRRTELALGFQKGLPPPVGYKYVLFDGNVTLEPDIEMSEYLINVALKLLASGKISDVKYNELVKDLHTRDIGLLFNKVYATAANHMVSSWERLAKIIK